MKNKIIASVIAALFLPMLIFIHWAIVYFLSVRIVLAIAMTVSIIKEVERRLFPLRLNKTTVIYVTKDKQN